MKHIITFCVAAFACVAARAEIPTFQAARSVWPQGRADEVNSRFVFKAAFDLRSGEHANLKMVAWYSYRVCVNGQFVGFGPARGPKGLFRADVWPLAAAKAGRNEVTVEVAGYNVPNFYQMKQPPFFKAEVVAGERVLAHTAEKGGAFVAAEAPHVRRVPRYSYQRTFAEVYRLPGEANPKSLPLAAAPEPRLIDRIAPYPDFEFNARMSPVSYCKVRHDKDAKVHTDRSMALPEKNPAFGGFPIAQLDVNSSHYVQRLIESDRRAVTDIESKADTFALKAGDRYLFDNGVCDAGFPGARVTVTKPGRLVMEFDEVLSADGSARGILRYRDCLNAIVWDFTAPGVYEIASFEPYVMRYVSLAVTEGEMSVSAPCFRSYKNPTAKRASFRASDPELVKIFNAASETFRQNAVDVFTDCPSRERAGWNCDAYFTGPVSTLLTGSTDLERLFEETLALAPPFEDIPDGMLPMCYPADFVQKGYIPNWAMWFVLETEEYLARSGDRATVDVLRPRFEKLLQWFWQYRNADGLLEKLPGWIFVEWSRANKLVQDVNYPTNMTWAEFLDAMNRLYGRADLAEEAKRVRETVRRQSWTGAWFCDNAVRQKDGSLKLSGERTETCQYYAFFFRVATPETHAALWKTLLMDFGPSRYSADRKTLRAYPEIWPSNAFIGNYLRLKLFERMNLGTRILDETKGFFVYMANRSGTLWENDTTCASCNHGFASYAAVLLVKSVLGAEIDLLKKTVTLRTTDVALEFCEATLPVGDESVTVTRRMKDGKPVTTAQVPNGWRIVRAER